MFVDMHCDALTSHGLTYGDLGLEEFTKSGNFQCFAVFIRDKNAAEYSAAVTLFNSKLKDYAVRTAGEANARLSAGLPCCALTCENIAFTGGDITMLERLKKDGVIMASLVWNNPNGLAYPNLRKDGKPEARGLTRRGKRALEILRGLKIMIDISHLSDGGAKEVLNSSKSPVVASHSCCRSLCANNRNLTDVQLKKLADTGGVAGVNFYNKFLGGQNAEYVAAHLKHMINAGGEDLPAFGGDWDGVPRGECALYPRDMPRFLEQLPRYGITPRAVEKIAFKNFLRAFAEAAG